MHNATNQDLQAGCYKLMTRQGKAMQSKRFRRVHTTISVIAVVLLLWGCDAWTRAQGTVRDSAGKPIPDAVVTLKIESDSRQFHSDKDGHYLEVIS